MYLPFVDILRCLECRNPLHLTPLNPPTEKGYVRDGILECSCGQWYPVIRGVPRILREQLLADLVLDRYPSFFTEFSDRLPERVRAAWRRHTAASPELLKVSTAESFGFEWKRFSKMFDEYRDNFLQYVQPYAGKDFVNKLVLDAGCGVGRHTYWTAKFGAKMAVGADLSDAVDPAEENCKELPNANIVQADLYDLPFGCIFDFVYSIGVLHHLPDPEKGFRHLLRHVVQGGIMLIWVYGHRRNVMARYLYEPLRTITRKLPKRALLPLCYPFAAIVEASNVLSAMFEKLYLKPIARILPFQYYRRFPFEVKLNDAFDVLATPKSRYYHMETIRAWFDRAELPDADLRYLREKSIIASSVR